MFFANPIADVMNNTEWAFPLAECFHIVAFALAIGTIAVVDLRLLGLGVTKQTPQQLLRDTELWTIAGLAVVLVSGPFIFLSRVEIYLVSASFFVKMYCLLAGLVFHYAVLRPVVRSGPAVDGQAGGDDFAPVVDRHGGEWNIHWIVSMSLATSIKDLGLLTYVRETPWVYPIIMATHLTCLALFGGMILLTDLRLLGVALTSTPVSGVVAGLRLWKRLGFAITVICGLLLAGSEAERYVSNPYFWIKMTLLLLVGVHTPIFKPQVYDHPEKLDNLTVMPRNVKVAAGISLILWISIPTMGRMIAYYEPEEQTSRKPGKQDQDRPTTTDLLPVSFTLQMPDVDRHFAKPEHLP
jgi:hypothetical protein